MVAFKMKVHLSWCLVLSFQLAVSSVQCDSGNGVEILETGTSPPPDIDLAIGILITIIASVILFCLVFCLLLCYFCTNCCRRKARGKVYGAPPTNSISTISPQYPPQPAGIFNNNYREPGPSTSNRNPGFPPPSYPLNPPPYSEIARPQESFQLQELSPPQYQPTQYQSTDFGPLRGQQLTHQQSVQQYEERYEKKQIEAQRYAEQFPAYNQ